MSTSFEKFKNIFPPKDRFWADPFIIFKNNKYYIFIEEFIFKTSKGHISVFEMDDKGNLKNPVKILEKDYHLAYPFVFEWENKLYMIPDTSYNCSIELYECIEFPNNWKFKMNLMQEIRAIDTTLLFYNDLWWLFTSLIENEGALGDDELFLFYSRNLFTTEWKNHPMNPIVSDIKNARPAGKIFEKDGKFYRPSQNCAKDYGYGFNLNEIKILTETEYFEENISSVAPTWDKIATRAHTFAWEGKLTIIDALMRKRRFFNNWIGLIEIQMLLNYKKNWINVL